MLAGCISQPVASVDKRPTEGLLEDEPLNVSWTAVSDEETAGVCLTFEVESANVDVLQWTATVTVDEELTETLSQEGGTFSFEGDQLTMTPLQLELDEDETATLVWCGTTDVRPTDLSVTAEVRPPRDTADTLFGTLTEPSNVLGMTYGAAPDGCVDIALQNLIPLPVDEWAVNMTLVEPTVVTSVVGIRVFAQADGSLNLLPDFGIAEIPGLGEVRGTICGSPRPEPAGMTAVYTIVTDD